MTVAAIILAIEPGAALREVAGVANARRLADTAWAGGALPIIVVAPDPDGTVAVALGGSAAVLAAPAPAGAGVAGQVVRGHRRRPGRGRGDRRSPGLAGPHGLGRRGDRDLPHRGPRDPTGGRPAPGLPRPARLAGAGARDAPAEAQGGAVVPGESALLDDLAASGVPFRTVELGDPGTTHDLATAFEELPPFEGPPEPAAEHHHEWGSPAAAGPDEPPDPARTAG